MCSLADRHFPELLRKEVNSSEDLVQKYYWMNGALQADLELIWVT